MKVFYSWQSDTPARVGRAFVREALVAAIAGLELEDAERPEIDQDTKGVLGSPVIADIIFQKIRHSKVVVADVTLTGQTPTGKRLCNSNVAIELGYALGCNGDEVLLKVMNTHYGRPADLPFDLAHRRWPVQFELSPEAKKDERSKVHDALVKELRQILQQYIEANRPRPEGLTPTSSTYNSAAYWQSDEALCSIESGGAKVSARYGPDEPLIYLHIWPSTKVAPLSSQILSDYGKATIEPLCGRGGWSWERNRHGLLTYATYRGSTQLASTTQVLKTGEIWGVNGHLLRDREASSPKYVPTIAYEEGIQKSLLTYLMAARTHFGYPARIKLESGLVNVADFYLAMSNNNYWGPIYTDVKVDAEVDMDDPATIDAALLKIFEQVFDAAGTPRPGNHNNFPPKAA